jgi:hypothetical protein
MYSSKYIFVSVIAVCAYAVFADEGAHGGAPHAAPHGQTYEQPHQEYYSRKCGIVNCARKCDRV